MVRGLVEQRVFGILGEPQYMLTREGLRRSYRILHPWRHLIGKHWFPAGVVLLNVATLIVTTWLSRAC